MAYNKGERRACIRCGHVYLMPEGVTRTGHLLPESFKRQPKNGKRLDYEMFCGRCEPKLGVRD